MNLALKKIFICFLVIIVFLGCKDSTSQALENLNNLEDSKKVLQKDLVDSRIDSSSQIKAEPSISIFLPSQNLLSNENKITILIFGSNGCGSCERLKNIISSNKNVQDKLKANYLVYYINLSEENEHKIDFHNKIDMIKTSSLKELFSVVGTPTTLFIKDKKIIFRYPGFMGTKRLISMLEVLKNTNLNIKQNDILKEILKYEKE
ncbi:MAG: thioredoxin fold domain-containing protein [Helicobacteraceae bacterium]|nr:thioredoxin fold domain-containing protein [Helicobacteraceae bacterium]